MRFTDEELAQAIVEFQNKAVARVVPAFGFNKDITIYGAENEPVQAASSGDPGQGSVGTE